MNDAKTTTVDSIPIEIFTGHILTQLPLAELSLSVRLVCRRWKDAVSLVGVKLSFSRQPLAKTASAIDIYPLVHSLDLTLPNYKERTYFWMNKAEQQEEPLTPPFMTDVLGRTKALQELTIQSSRKAVPPQHLIDGLLSISATLACLDWTIVKPSHFEDPFGVISQLPHLVHLAIKNVSPQAADLDRLGTLAKQLRSLTVLIFDKPRRGDDAETPLSPKVYSMDRFNQLEALDLKYKSRGELQISNLNQICFDSPLENLRSLSLTYLKIVLPAGRQTGLLFPKLANLTLDTEDLHSLVLPLGDIVRHAPSLKKAEIMGTVTHADTLTMAATCNLLAEARLWLRNTPEDEAKMKENEKEGKGGYGHPISSLYQLRCLRLCASDESRSRFYSSPESDQNLPDWQTLIRAVSQLPQLTNLEIVANDVKVEDFGELCSFECASSLKSLKIFPCTQINGRFLTELTRTFNGLTSLELLHLEDRITPSSIASLSSLSGLRRLVLSNLSLPDLAALKDLPLDYLELSRGVFSARLDCLSALGEGHALNSLKTLKLLGSEFDDDALKPLTQMSRLEVLDLRGSNMMTKRALKYIAQCPSLQQLGFSESRFMMEDDSLFAGQKLHSLLNQKVESGEDESSSTVPLAIQHEQEALNQALLVARENMASIHKLLEDLGKEGKEKEEKSSPEVQAALSVVEAACKSLAGAEEDLHASSPILEALLQTTQAIRVFANDSLHLLQLLFDTAASGSPSSGLKLSEDSLRALRVWNRLGDVTLFAAAKFEGSQQDTWDLTSEDMDRLRQTAPPLLLAFGNGKIVEMNPTTLEPVAEYDLKQTSGGSYGSGCYSMEFNLGREAQCGLLNVLIEQSKGEAQGTDSPQIRPFGGPTVGLDPRIGSAFPSMVAVAQLQLNQLNASIHTLLLAEELGSESPLPLAKRHLQALHLAFEEAVNRWLSTAEKEKEAGLDVVQKLKKHLEAIDVTAITKSVLFIFSKLVELLARQPPKAAAGQTIISLACETGYSGGRQRVWIPTEPRWRVCVLPSDSVQTLHAKLKAVCPRPINITYLLHATSATVRRNQDMKHLDLNKTLEENGVTSDSVIRWHNGMAD